MPNTGDTLRRTSDALLRDLEALTELESEKRTIRGREYLLFYNGDRLRMVGWKTDHAAYWISNTLLQNVSAKEMLGVARSLVRAR